MHPGASSDLLTSLPAMPRTDRKIGLREEWLALALPGVSLHPGLPYPNLELFEGLQCVDTCGLHWRPCMPPFPADPLPIRSVGSGHLSLRGLLVPSLSLMPGHVPFAVKCGGGNLLDQRS